MEIERGTGVALWRQIQKILEREIRDRAFGEGGKLPTEKALSDRFRVNRHTVRRALSVLEDKKLIRVEQGRGAFVRENVVNYALSRRVRFSKNLSRHGKSPGGRILRWNVQPASKEAAHWLRIRPGAEVLLLETLGEADERPVCITTHFFPHAMFPGFQDLFRITGSVTETFKRFNIRDYIRKRTRITVRNPDTREAALLDQSRNRPVLVSESVNADLRDTPLEYGISIWAGDRVQLVVEQG